MNKKDLGHGLIEYGITEIEDARNDALLRSYSSPILSNGQVLRVGLTRKMAELVINPAIDDEEHRKTWPGTWSIVE